MKRLKLILTAAAIIIAIAAAYATRDNRANAAGPVPTLACLFQV